MNECKLTEMKCVPCQGGVPPLAGEALLSLHKELGQDWKLVDEHHIEKDYEFEDFKSALDFVNKVGDLAEAEGHHPDIYLSWGKVTISLWTHKINGLSESDFVLAAKAETLYH